jgi:energy-coupling factor transport system permease protein
MSFFVFKKKLNPVFAFVSGVFIVVYGLVFAKSAECSYFLLAAYVWLALFGCLKTCLTILPVFAVVASIFFGIFYGATGEILPAVFMVNRLGAIFVGIIPGKNTEAAAMTRSLSQMRVPRAATLGMLIALSFVPMLASEIRRVRESMKTRGAGSALNPKIFYRAFLVPFVMRLVSISDTLALSVETRGFVLGKTQYTVYKKETVSVSDLLYAAGLAAAAILAALL